ncbi:unnamed protein product [Haemonchus placei]|uniref:Uncharacterized protein n=1 Tax=Haemonchus placei TaxID=6290 RepID=A0A0N4WU87_HAEPC|nr:unnamed protein product [Haemonchus placei]
MDGPRLRSIQLKSVIKPEQWLASSSTNTAVMIAVILLLLAVANCEDKNKKAPEVSEQLDPSVYMRPGLFGAAGPVCT